MNFEDIDVLLDVLGNDTRRRILQLLADEPRYFIQLSKDLGVSQQAVLKHLEILERHGFVSSYESDSEFAAPKRKYFQLDRSCMLAVGITRDAVEFVFRDIPLQELDSPSEDKELRTFAKEVSQIEKERDIAQKLNSSDKLLKELNERLTALTKTEIALLRLKQQVTKTAHEAIRKSFGEELQRQILYETLGEEKQLNVDQLSVILDTREKEISSALRILKQKLSPSPKS